MVPHPSSITPPARDRKACPHRPDVIWCGVLRTACLDRPENALARQERARRDAGQPILDLTESNPTRVGLTYPTEGLREALAAAHVTSLRTGAAGPAPLAREAVARDTPGRTGDAIDAGQIVLTASSSESYALLFKLLCDPGDAVLVPEPSYPLFDYLARLEGVSARSGTGWPRRRLAHRLRQPRRGAARAGAAGGRAARVVVVNPNNPTGSFVVGHRDSAAG